MNTIQLVRRTPISATYLFFVKNDELRCAKHNGAPAPSPYPTEGAYPVYSGSINGFSVVQHDTAMLECVIDTPDKGYLVLYSDDAGRSWNSKSE